MLRQWPLAVVLAIGSALSAAAQAPAPPPQATTASPPAAAAPAPAKRAVKRSPRRPKGYGFLPGYEPPPDNNRPDFRRNARPAAPHGPYWSWGQWYYGWGSPGFVRGRWNGGSIGPCWTSTPIGFVWICG